MKISVIIPVYNAEHFVEEAVLSALGQQETAEILLIEDGSPDNALKVCQTLEKKYPIIRLLRHKNGENRGAAASRNLGIKNATCEFLSFLDADDFYLPNRFVKAKQIFLESPKTEAVFEAVGTKFESKIAENQWNAINGPSITALDNNISKDRIFECHSPVGKSGHCHLNGLTIRKSTALAAGMFDEQLVLVEDTGFFLKVTSIAAIELGATDDLVAMRRVHHSNRITKLATHETQWKRRLSFWITTLKFLREKRPDRYKERMRLIISKIHSDIEIYKDGKNVLRRYFLVLYSYPMIFFSSYFLRGIILRFPYLGKE